MADKDEQPGRIAVNRRARHEFFIEERLEAGIALQGWEVKALRAGRLQLAEAYVLLKDMAWSWESRIIVMTTGMSGLMDRSLPNGLNLLVDRGSGNRWQ